MVKTIQQNFANVNTNYVYEAKFNYEIQDVIKVFRDNLNSRHDLDEGFKNAALSMPIGKNYEIVYYPTYFYKTNTEKTWNTTSTEETSTTITTTTYKHTSSGHKGTSELQVKASHYELDVLNVNLDTCGQVTNYRSLTLGLYDKDLIYSQSENKKNGIEAGRKASNATKNQSTYTIYTIYMVIVPILRYQFEYDGKKYLFEMNLHNGAFLTDYKQKTICTIASLALNITYRILTIGAFALPIVTMISRFLNAGCSSNGFFTNLLAVLGLFACAIVGFICFGAFCGKKKYTFERMMYQPINIFKLFIWPVVWFSIIVTVTSICANIAFA